MRAWWRSISAEKKSPDPDPGSSNDIDLVYRRQEEYGRLDDSRLKELAARAATLPEVVAVTAVVASRVLGLQMFDVQLQGALALASGRIVEMQTGEGKTLAAVPAIVWLAKSGLGVHVLTANDYLARRDAAWMGGIYEWLGVSAGAVQQEMTSEQRQTAYARDVTYATANEVGFDYLRDQLALHPHEQVLRPAVAVIDEADSILIDEARIPLVIAGGSTEPSELAREADRAVRRLIPHHHFTIEQAGRNVALTTAGVGEVEWLLDCTNFFDAENLSLMSAVQDALHAHALLKRDVDYVVQEDAVLSVDELKGRIVRERRWPAGLQTAIELKEGVSRKRQGRILGSLTIESLVSMYSSVCGMTGTAVTQAQEFRELYALDVVAIPPNRPVIRVDHPDRAFDTRAAKEAAVVEEIRLVHGSGRPVLVGTSSVEESERLSRMLPDVPHEVLNARNEEAEAAIIARAGERGAVTISTNMAGRGVDIRLGSTVADLGGLHVIGANRHESRRIDHQLRGRAGRQGDPGSSRFFVSSEDSLMMKFAADDVELRRSPDAVQRIAEGQNLDIRIFLRKYDSIVEGQRRALLARRQRVLAGEAADEADEAAGQAGELSESDTSDMSERERLITLMTIDDLWSDYLVAVGELRTGSVWLSLGGGNPFADYLLRVHAMFDEFQRTIDEEVALRLEDSTTDGFHPSQRGATWTYLTTDEPFGTMTERIMRGLVRLIRSRSGRGAG